MIRDVRPSRILIGAAAMSAILLAVLILPLVREHRAEQLHPHLADDAEQAAIMRSFINDEQLYAWLYSFALPRLIERNGKVLDSVVVADSSYTICDQPGVHPDLDVLCREEKAWPETTAQQPITGPDDDPLEEPAIPMKLAMELIAANQKSIILPDPKSPDILMRPRAVIEGLAHSSTWPEMASQFENLFPHSTIAIEVSRAVLSDDHNDALVYVEFLGIPTGQPGGKIYCLARNGKGWRTLPYHREVMFDRLALWRDEPSPERRVP